MAKSLINIIDVIKKECLGYKWGESDCVSLLERIYEYKFNYYPHTINFRSPWMENNHARAIAISKRNFGSLQKAYEKSLSLLNFYEITNPTSHCAFITKEKVTLYLNNFLNSNDSKTYKFNLDTWHGAILGIMIMQGNSKLHLIYQLDGVYLIKNITSVYKYFDYKVRV